MKIIKWPAKYWFAICVFLPVGARAQETPMTYDQYSEMAGSYHFQEKSVSLDQFLEKMKDPGAVILDLRDDAAFSQSHVQGALHLDSHATLADLRTAIPSKNATVLLYNSNSLTPTTLIDQRSALYPELISYGYRNVFTLAPVWENNPGYHDDLKKLAMTEPLSSAPQSPGIYAKCLGDYDCVVAEDDCPGTFTAINKKYVPEHTAEVNSRRPLIECAGPGANAKKPSSATCQNGACVIQ